MVRNRNILIITPFFPPQTHAAVFRAFKLVKYLKRMGWNPIVLTVNRNYLYLEDPDLLKEIEDVPIYRANYIEPTLRGLKMLLGGKDTTFKNTTCSNDKIVKAENTLVSTKERSRLKQLYHYLLNRWIQVPDRFIFWENNAVKMANKIIKKYDISIIYTTCLPFTCNRIGVRLKKQNNNIKWVADFRDPITYAKRMYSNYLPVFVKQKKIEQDTFKFADRIVGLSEAYMYIFNDLYQGKYSYKCDFIPTGIDDDYIPKQFIPHEKKENSIIFVGEYLKEYQDEFLQIYAKAIKDKRLQGKKCLLKIVGNIQLNKKVLDPIIKHLNIEEYIQYIDHMSQNNLYNEICKSKAAVLIPGRTAFWWNNFAKMVDYIGLQIPVLAMVPLLSEARTQLTKAGNGIFLDDEKKSVELIISVFLSDFKLSINHQYCKIYLASSQVKAFIDIFNEL